MDYRWWGRDWLLMVSRIAILSSEDRKLLTTRLAGLKRASRSRGYKLKASGQSICSGRALVKEVGGLGKVNSYSRP